MKAAVMALLGPSLENKKGMLCIPFFTSSNFDSLQFFETILKREFEVFLS